jgi:hypothetical protein
LSGLKGAFGAGSERGGGVSARRGSGRARGYALQGLLLANLRQPRPHFLIGTLDFLPLGIGGGGNLAVVRRRLVQAAQDGALFLNQGGFGHRHTSKMFLYCRGRCKVSCALGVS